MFEIWYLVNKYEDITLMMLGFVETDKCKNEINYSYTITVYLEELDRHVSSDEKLRVKSDAIFNETASKKLNVSDLIFDEGLRNQLKKFITLSECGKCEYTKDALYSEHETTFILPDEISDEISKIKKEIYEIEKNNKGE